MNTQTKISGQYTNNEFEKMCTDAGFGRYGRNYENGTAWIRYGKNTTNYYCQHEDGSWTNYDCKTS